MDTAKLLQISMFALGAIIVLFALWKISKGTSAKSAWPLFLFASVFLVCGMFGDRIKDLKIGKEGVEFSLSDIKAAAEQAVEQNPDLAHQVSNKKGAGAIADAKNIINNAKSQDDLDRILKVEKSNGAVYFTPRNHNARFAYPIRIQNKQMHVEAPIAANQVPSPEKP